MNSTIGIPITGIYMECDWLETDIFFGANEPIYKVEDSIASQMEATSIVMNYHPDLRFPAAKLRGSELEIAIPGIDQDDVQRFIDRAPVISIADLRKWLSIADYFNVDIVHAHALHPEIFTPVTRFVALNRDYWLNKQNHILFIPVEQLFNTCYDVNDYKTIGTGFANYTMYKTSKPELLADPIANASILSGMYKTMAIPQSEIDREIWSVLAMLPRQITAKIIRAISCHPEYNHALMGKPEYWQWCNLWVMFRTQYIRERHSYFTRTPYVLHRHEFIIDIHNPADTVPLCYTITKSFGKAEYNPRGLLEPEIVRNNLNKYAGKLAKWKPRCKAVICGSIVPKCAYRDYRDVVPESAKDDEHIINPRAETKQIAIATKSDIDVMVEGHENLDEIASELMVLLDAKCERIETENRYKYKLVTPEFDVDLFSVENIDHTICKFHLACVRAYFYLGELYYLPSFLLCSYNRLLFEIRFTSCNKTPGDIIRKYVNRGFIYCGGSTNTLKLKNRQVGASMAISRWKAHLERRRMVKCEYVPPNLIDLIG